MDKLVRFRNKFMESPTRRELVWFSLYVVLALVATRPLVMSLGSAIPQGCENETTVPLFNLWTLWWNVDRAAHGLVGYWTAPIFYPTTGTFAFSETQPTMVVVAPLVWVTGSLVLGYNVYQLLILALNGWSVCRLLRSLEHRPWLAFCGGAMCELLPFIWWQLGVVQLTTLFGIVWTIHSLMDLFARDDSSPKATAIEVSAAGGNSESASSLDRESSWWSQLVWLRLGGSFGLTYWLCNYWGLFLAILLVPSSVCFWNRRLRAVAFWREVVLAAIVAGVMVLPIAYIQRHLSKEHSWTRDGGLIVSLSAHVRDLTDTPWDPLIPGLEHPEQPRSNMWPLGGGGCKLLLAPIGLLAALTRRGRRRWGLFVALLGLIAFGLSLGPNNRLADWLPAGLAGQSPYEWLQDYVPGFRLIRSPFRFVLFVQLAAILLSVEALDLLSPRRWSRSVSVTDQNRDSLPPVDSQNPIKLTIRGFMARIPLMITSLIVTLEVLPPSQSLVSCPTPRELPVWVMWLRDNSPRREPIACLPFPTGYTVGSYEDTAMWMYWSTYHGHPLVNGYSGFFPKSFLAIKDELEHYYKGELPDDVEVPPKLKLYPWNNLGLKRLNASGAVYAVVPRSFATRDDVWEHAATKFRWAWVTGDEAAQIDIYRIEPPLAE